MSRDQYLLGINMATGVTTRAYRDEVHDESVAGALDLLVRARYERVRMPALGPYMAITRTSHSGNAMVATIWRGQHPVVTFGCASTSRASAALWGVLVDGHCVPLAVDCSSRPQPPWIAARIEVGSALVSQDIRMAIGGMESAIGWAFLQMHQ